MLALVTAECTSLLDGGRRERSKPTVPKDIARLRHAGRGLHTTHAVPCSAQHNAAPAATGHAAVPTLATHAPRLQRAGLRSAATAASKRRQRAEV